MMTKKRDIHIQGLTDDQVQRLELLAHEQGYEHRSDFLRHVLATIIEQGEFNQAIANAPMQELLASLNQIVSVLNMQSERIIDLTESVQDLESLLISENSEDDLTDE